MIRTFTFNGTSSQGQLFVNEVTRSMLPPISNYSREIAKRHGAITYGYKFGVREITIKVTVMGINDTDLWTKINSLNAWLFTEEPKQLYFNDEPDKVYNAMLSGDSDLETLVSMGSATLTFLCFDPFKYALTEKTVVGSELSQTITNGGNFHTFPRFRIYSSASFSDITVTLQETGQKISFLGRSIPANAAIIIDNKTNFVYLEKTGENLMKYVSLDSEFFPLAVGDNTVSHNKDTTFIFRTYWTERWL